MTLLTNDGVLAAAQALGVQTLPVVLSVAPHHDAFAEWEAANRAARSWLERSGLVDSYGELDGELATAMHTLSQPDCELNARIFRGGPPTRICLARRGEQHAIAIRTGDDYDIRTLWCDGSGASLAKPITDALGSAQPADLINFSAPSHDLSERLAAATTSADYADAVYALGVAAHDATNYGIAFASCHAYAEIVVCAHEFGVTTRPPGAVAVYDTGRGRVVAAPGVAADQQLWSTVTPGTDHRVAQAITALIETLPVGRWL
ncbi:ESX secretion-associated protein EspG [Nocardia panacis]|uniref:ESX secretion-associated protein EspG n=1 Tax=Nocardia panacis TaxID=2340916 RepID=A0A3A4KDI8_9NOCA|nr:ESX secretion-associated protein EspG [Nocardia panacis]RJO72102.1 ESX secretion-associated protein EspG [Nocardia panacis]